MLKKTRPLPNELFDNKTVKQTYSFIESLTKEDIVRYRIAYKRELNSSNENNLLPEATLTKRRCFLYLTANYETIIA